MLESSGFVERFDGTQISEAWRTTGGSYALRDGRLQVQQAHNHPLWLRRRLPHDVRIEFDACATTADGDIKLEVFGDGHAKATSVSYVATGYVVVFGGWSNSLNVIARLDEHGSDRVVGARRAVVPNKVYRMRVERQGSALTVWADDRQLGRLVDRRPLHGRGHDHFAFNNWEAGVWFDNLRIRKM